MFFWFIGWATVSVWYVFADARFDYRLLLVGALVPDLLDVWSGHARFGHSLIVTVATLVVVMVITAGRKPIRRLLLGLPIGMLLHLVFDGIFAATRVLWWPFSGSWGNVRLPSLQRGWLNVPFEVVGIVLIAFVWRRCELADERRRQAFVEHGVLMPRVAAR